MKLKSVISILMFSLFLCYCSSDEVDSNELIVDPTNVDTTGTVRNQFGMDFKMISAGNFTMGSSESYADFEGERPAHQVTLTNNYFIGIAEVTQEQYAAVMGNNPSSNIGDNLPVTNLTWNDAVNFCIRLTELTGNTYRLPTDAEWEYACRAGSSNRFFWGEDESLTANYCWYESNSGGRIHNVKTKQPNVWGLYDMSGNVEEWVLDLYNMMSSSPQTDPQGPSRDAWGNTTAHVLRGGNIQSSPRFLHACWRHGDEGGMNARGFRVVREVE